MTIFFISFCVLEASKKEADFLDVHKKNFSDDKVNA